MNNVIMANVLWKVQLQPTFYGKFNYGKGIVERKFSLVMANVFLKSFNYGQ